MNLRNLSMTGVVILTWTAGATLRASTVFTDLGTDVPLNWTAHAGSGVGTPFEFIPGFLSITSNSQQSGTGIPGFVAASWDGFASFSESFSVAANTTATLQLAGFSADDRGAVFLDGINILNSALFGPGQGLLNIGDGHGDQPFFFNNTQGGTFAVLPGAHNIVIAVDNTGSQNLMHPTGNFVNASDQLTAGLGATLAVTQTPEPKTMLLLGCGLIALSGLRKRAV
jgi:hypothetical protein